MNQLLMLAIAWAAVAVVLSVVSVLQYWLDKRKASADAAKGTSRIPEKQLLIIDMLGGWPGGLWAQRKFRHKTVKRSYRVRFWAAVLVNVVAWGVVVWVGR